MTDQEEFEDESILIKFSLFIHFISLFLSLSPIVYWGKGGGLGPGLENILKNITL